MINELYSSNFNTNNVQRIESLHLKQYIANCNGHIQKFRTLDESITLLPFQNAPFYNYFKNKKRYLIDAKKPKNDFYKIVSNKLGIDYENF